MTLVPETNLNETGHFKVELINTIKGKYPDFPQVEKLIAIFVSEYPSLIISKEYLVRIDKSEEIEQLVIQDIIEYKKTLKLALKNKLDSIFHLYIDERLKNGFQIPGPQDLKLLNSYKTLVKQVFDNLIDLKMKSTLDKCKIPNAKIKLAESSLVDTIKSIALKINTYTGFLPR